MIYALPVQQKHTCNVFNATVDVRRDGIKFVIMGDNCVSTVLTLIAYQGSFGPWFTRFSFDQ